MTLRLTDPVKRSVLALVSATCMILSGLSVFGAAAQAASTFDPALVNDEFVIGGMSQAVAADWLPDGRMVVLTKPGSVYVVNTATETKSLLYTIPDVDSRGESGALDIVVDLSFATSHRLYVYYSANSDSRLRIAKLEVDSLVTTVSSNVTIWSNPGPLRTVYADPTNHIGGSLDIGPDGKFYLTIGDALASLSQDLTNVFGKVLRINLDGSVPADNPDIEGKIIREIWAYGLRNPYRGQFERARTTANPQGAPASPLWIGDVGGNVAETAYEELNVGKAGANYGWPLCEGPLGLPKNGVACPAGVTGPALTYGHTAGVACCFNKAIIGGQMYRSGNFPLAGAYIYGDYPSSTISWMVPDASGQPTTNSGLVHRLQTNNLDEAPVWVDLSPDGNIYFLDIFTGNLRRLTYGPHPIVQTASANAVTGPVGRDVTFTGAATDPAGNPVSYLWNFGDGTTSTLASPVHRYVNGGTYSALLKVTAGGVTVNANPIKIKVGNGPNVTITSPADGFVFTAGQTVVATGTATDANGKSLPPNQLSWTIAFRHDEHSHPEITNQPGSSVSLPIPTSGHEFAGNTAFLISLTATDSSNVSTTTSIEIKPTKIAIPVTSNIPTIAVLSGITQALPFAIDTVPGFQHSVEVPAEQCVNGVRQQFVRWSDGGARVHTVTAAAGQSLVATFEPTDMCESKYVPLPPVRLFDSRDLGAKPQANVPVEVGVTGVGGVPGLGATAVVVNVTAVDAAEAGFVTVWPSGEMAPIVSNINVRVGETAPNLVTVSPGTNGGITILPTSRAHLLVDVFGYYTASPSSVDGRFVPLPSPQRLYDTRSLGPKPGDNAERTVTVAGSVGVPASGAEAVVLNVTADDASAPGYITVWPAGGKAPQVSNINLDHVGQTRANQVIVKLGDGGAISLLTSNGAHLIVDVVGYFTAGGTGPATRSGLFVPAGPARLLDTRNDAKPIAGSSTNLAVVGQRGVPAAGVLAIVANTTVVDAAAPGFVTVYPRGQAVPNTSNLNVEGGQTIANHVTTLVQDGGVSLHTTVDAHLLVDLAGWYTT
jgi:glucose/arabinose dehydrogenase